MRLRKVLILAASLGLCATTTACGGGDADPAASPAGQGIGSSAPLSGDITVFAAASLTDAFDELGRAFQAEHPAVTVRFNFGASSTLVTQIDEGAPADVFAAADEANMQKLVDAAGSAGAPVTFAHNELAVIVGKGNPRDVQSVKDLSSPDLVVVTCGPQVPIGAYSQQVFDRAGITVSPASYEENVRAVVSKVTSGEADAGIVYVTDVTAAGEAAEGVPIPDDLNVIATYPITVTGGSANTEVADAFVGYVTGSDGQAILATYGFAPK